MKKWIRFSIALLLVGGGFLLHRQLSPTQTVATTALPSPTYIIDGGHGGEDGGAISVTGTSESVINLSIALKLEHLLALYGHCPVLVRREDISLHDEGCTTLREKKVSDLHNRVQLVEETENGILISIHQNSYTDSQYDGFQTFYAPVDGSCALAESVQTALRTALDPENDREVKEIYDSVYLLTHITRPAILVECGFLTNPAEAERLETDCYQLQLSMGILGGILQNEDET